VLAGIGQDPLLLDHRPPELRVAHEGDAQDLLVLVQELVLAQHTESHGLGDGYLAGGRLFLPGQDSEQGRLSRPVGADQAVAVTGVEQERRVTEQGPVAEGLL
jgi:hypothetical protein